MSDNRNFIKIDKRATKKIKAGYPWIYSNEIIEKKIDLSVSIVDILGIDGLFLGSGYYNKHSLIAARILSDKKIDFDKAFFVSRIKKAFSQRKKLYPNFNSLRVVYGESDFLPGLVIDKYEDLVVIELNTKGIYMFKDLIVDAIDEVLNPVSIILKNSSSVLKLEGLPMETEVLKGKLEPIVIEENGIKFFIDPVNGQKTGFFFDQKENRKALISYAQGNVAHDIFSYSGGWGLYLLKAKAKKVFFVDVSESALDIVKENLKLNGFSNGEVVKVDAFSYLRTLKKNSCDLIVLDPPAFAKSKKDIKKAQKGYVDINREAIKALASNGILATSTCSYHISEANFNEILYKATYESGSKMVKIYNGIQAYDHPILINFPESNYLKTYFGRKI